METNELQHASIQPLRLVGMIFLIIGLVFLLLGAFFYDRQQTKAKTMQEGTGIIVSFDANGCPYVLYELNGQTYEGRLSFSSSDMELGGELPIYFDPHVPEHVEIGGWGALLLPILFLGMGALFALLGGAMFLLQRRIRLESETAIWQG